MAAPVTPEVVNQVVNPGTIAILMAVVYAVRRLFPKLPGAVVPWLALVGGVIAQILGPEHKFTMDGTLEGLVNGTGAIGAWETVGKQVMSKVTKSKPAKK